MSAQRRSSAVGALTSAINPSIDSYIEKKRAMEERARQIKEERANRKPELDQAAQSRAAELNRFRRPAMPPAQDDYDNYNSGAPQYQAPPSQPPQSDYNHPPAHSSHRSAASTSSLPPSNNYSAPPAAQPPAQTSSAATGRSRQAYSAAPHGPPGGGTVTMSRAEYDALLDRMQHMENELTFLRDKHSHFVEDFEATNADLISVRQEVKNLQRVVKASKTNVSATPTPPTAAAPSKPASGASSRYGSYNEPAPEDEYGYAQGGGSYAAPPRNAPARASAGGPSSAGPSRAAPVASSGYGYSQQQQQQQQPQSSSYGAQRGGYADYDSDSSRNHAPSARSQNASQQPVAPARNAAPAPAARNAPAAAAGRSIMQQPMQNNQYGGGYSQQQASPPSFDDQPIRAGGQSKGYSAYPSEYPDDDQDDQNDQEDDDEQGQYDDEQGGEEDDGAERLPCSVCGRKFVPKSLARHMKICEKVFVKKRKPMQVQRLSEEAQRELKELQRQKARKGTKAAPPPKQSDVPKWKIERAQLREALRAGREYTRAIEQGIEPPPMPAASAAADDRVECPHCGRRFAELAAQRHIPKCATQKARPAPPPNRR